MDARLWSIFTMRPETLKRPDLPTLARLIVGYNRRLGVALHAGFIKNVSYVLFQAPGVQALIRGDDWQKIVPYLLDDELSPPPEPLKPWTNVAIANVDVYDTVYYLKVLGVLQGLFTEDFPTSYL
jgi:hypothetical protein